MSGYSGPIGAASTHAGAGSPPIGTRVWLLRDGRAGRVVALSQGGLLCHVRPEDGGSTLRRPGGELLPLAAEGPV